MRYFQAGTPFGIIKATLLRLLCTLTLVFLVFLTTGCQLAQSAFVKTTNNAGAAFSAASLTLSYAHQGKITAAYARAAFANYQSELSGLDQQLPSQTGAPDAASVQQLLRLYKPAMQAINQPCLDVSCGWRSQLAALTRASEAFLNFSTLQRVEKG